MKTEQMKKYAIDAEGKSIGRVASEVALLLQGKNIPQYAKHKLPVISVEVRNVSKVKISGKKFKSVHRRKHTGYPGSLRKITLGQAFARNPQAVFRRAVFGMLPKNRLRDKMLKHLVVHNTAEPR